MADDKKKDKPQERNSDPATIKCKVHWANADPENKLVPIPVNAIGRNNGKKVFIPDTEVNLTQAQINILRSAIEDGEHIISDDSGIYQAKDPIKMAKEYYPGCKISQDRTTGLLKAIREAPRFIVELAPSGGF